MKVITFFLLLLLSLNIVTARSQSSSSLADMGWHMMFEDSKRDYIKNKSKKWDGDASRYLKLFDNLEFLIDTLNALKGYHWIVKDSLDGFFACDTTQGIKGFFTCLYQSSSQMVFFAQGEYDPPSNWKGRASRAAIVKLSKGKAEFPLDGRAVFWISYKQQGKKVHNQLFLRLKVDTNDKKVRDAVGTLMFFVGSSLFNPVNKVFEIWAADTTVTF